MPEAYQGLGISLEMQDKFPAAADAFLLRCSFLALPSHLAGRNSPAFVLRVLGRFEEAELDRN